MKQHSTKILSICLIVAIAYIYHQDKQHGSLVVDNQQLTEQLEKANVLLLESEEKIALLEKKSIDGMLKETNKVVVSGWETLLDTVKEELTKAKKRFDELKRDEGDGSDSDILSAPQTPNAAGSRQESQEQQELPIIDGERT